MRHFLEIDDLTADELHEVLDLSEALDRPQLLAGRSVTLIFEKPSARTRASMEVAVAELGGHPVAMSNAEVGVDVRETAEDLGRLFSGYSSLIAARVFEHHKLERMAATATVPVINLLSDLSHPIQVLADLLTVRAEFGRLDNLTIAWVGDANNVARSLAIGCHLVGARFRVAHPPGHGFADQTSADLARKGCTPLICASPAVAVSGADVVYTDAWYSMGQEAQAAQRRQTFTPYRIDEALMSGAATHAVFLHCLPAHRGDEATNGVLDGPQSRIWPQAHNRLHSSRGLMRFMLEHDLDHDVARGATP